MSAASHQVRVGRRICQRPVPTSWVSCIERNSERGPSCSCTPQVSTSMRPTGEPLDARGTSSRQFRGSYQHTGRAPTFQALPSTANAERHQQAYTRHQHHRSSASSRIYRVLFECLGDLPLGRQQLHIIPEMTDSTCGTTQERTWGLDP